MGFFLTDWIKHPSHLPVVGSIFGTTPEQDALKKQIANLQGVYAQYRPMAAQGQMNGLNQRLQAFAPVNNLIGQIEGKGDRPFFDLQALGKNPMPEGMLDVGGQAPKPAPAQPAAPGPGAAYFGGPPPMFRPDTPYTVGGYVPTPRR